MVSVSVRLVGVGTALCLSVGVPARAEPGPDKRPPLSPELAAEARRAIHDGLAYLRSTQEKDGGWTAAYGPAVTAIAAKAFVQDEAYGPRRDEMIVQVDRQRAPSDLQPEVGQKLRLGTGGAFCGN